MLHKKGFTLIELIIVIALIALLATTVILVINPVKIFQEARDSQRIADLGQMNSAMSIMLATSSATPVLAPAGQCILGGSPKCFQNKVASNCGPRYATVVASSTIASQAVTGSGWVPVDLTASSTVAARAA